MNYVKLNKLSPKKRQQVIGYGCRDLNGGFWQGGLLIKKSVLECDMMSRGNTATQIPVSGEVAFRLCRSYSHTRGFRLYYEIEAHDSSQTNLIRSITVLLPNELSQGG